MQTNTITNAAGYSPAVDTLKLAIVDALDVWIRQRPGLEPGNYIRDWRDVDGRRAYRAESRSITRDLHQARAMLRYVELRPSITGERLAAAFEGRRLSYTPGQGLDYTVGQYWPTEYRRAACGVLSSAIWDWLRDNMPPGQLVHNSETGETFERYNGMRAGDWIRAAARRELGATIAGRWFS
jgi:hypothetical protein